MKMQGNAKAKFDEIQADMDANNKRRKQLRVQIKKEEEHLEDLKKVRYPDFLSISLSPSLQIQYQLSRLPHISLSLYSQLPAKNEKEMAESETKIASLEVKKKTEEEKLQSNTAELNEKAQPLRARKEKLQEELGAVEEQVNDAKQQLTLAESALQLVQQNELQEKRRYDSMKYGLEETMQELEQSKTELQGLEATVPEIKKEIDKCRQTIGESKAEEHKLGEEMAGLNSIVSDEVTMDDERVQPNLKFPFLLSFRRLMRNSDQ